MFTKKAIFIMLIALVVSVLFSSSGLAQGSDKEKEEETAREWLQFETAGRGKYKGNVGIRYKRNDDGTVDVDVASMATGKGADFRKWEVIDTKLLIENEPVRPVSYDRIYTTKESMFRMPAAVVFTAIGAAYGIYADKCETGGTCPVTGQPIGGKAARGGIATGIDTAGMAVGLGLLTSQAKGEITGQKASFKLTQEEAKKLKGVKLTVEYKGTGKRDRIEVPVEGVPSRIKGDQPSAKQPLSRDDLNSTLDYLDTRDRTTRPQLVGTGIVSGFEARESGPSPAEEKKERGRGIPSEGYPVRTKE
ncbi:MAG: hypothetical protein WBD24_06730 [Candidatus Omnitrophota bacterium]